MLWAMMEVLARQAALGLTVVPLARAIEAKAHGRGNGEDGKVEYVHNGLQSRPRQAA